VRRLLHALPVVVAVVALPLALAIARDGEGPVRATGASAAAGVTDDDGGEPMFALAALAPGRSMRRCIRVRYGGEADGSVRLAGRVEGAALARRIALVVERGSSGGFDGCSEFRGVRVYSGTLADFTDSEEARAWLAEDGDAATYRFTATAATDLPAQSDRAAATFTWHATAVPGEGPGGGPGDGDDDADTPGGGGPPLVAGGPAGAGPGPGPVPGGDRGERGDPRTAGTGRGGRDGAGRPAGGAAGRGADVSAAGGGAGTGTADGKRERSTLGRALESFGRAAVDVGQRAAFPVLLLLIIGLFLAAQHRIDQRDPKLALAPVHRELELHFTPLDLSGARPVRGGSRE
jgi:hypothetical protein